MSEVTLKSINEARERIQKYIRKTPLYDAPTLSKKTGNNIFIKYENLQRTGSFKVRGALNKILSLSEDEMKKGVVAASAGNHAQGVALGAELRGIKATIVMPIHAPLQKIVATKSYGAEVVLSGEIYDDAYAKACEIKENTGAVFIHAFDDEDVIAGQGTIGLEILEELENVDIVLVPIGGGGLAAGISKAIKSIKPNVEVIGVQSENAASMVEAVSKGSPCDVKTKQTIADGIAVRKAGEKTCEVIKANVDKIITVSDDEIANAILYLIENGKVVSEGAGAAAYAAVLGNKLNVKNKNICIVVSGGNIDINLMDRIINRALFNTGRRYEFKVTLKDKPGEFEKLLDKIRVAGANILFTTTPSMYSKNMMINEKKVRVVVECTDEEHRKELEKSMELDGYDVEGVK